MSDIDSHHSDRSVELLSSDPPALHSPRLVFRDRNNSSIGFTFNNDVDESTKVALARDIKKHGGTVLESAVGADTLLIVPEQDKTVLQLACNSSRNKARAQLRVEHTTFIQQCIRRGYFRHTRPKIKAMHGVPEGNGRTAFNNADFENLCWHISRLLPDPSAGGRQSLHFYNMLVILGRHDPEYTWTRRHTAESWKEHYKKNKVLYKTRIEELVEEDPPDSDRRWIRDRRLTKSSLRHEKALHRRQEEEESGSGEESQVESQDENEVITQLKPTSQKRRRSGHTSATLLSVAKRPRTSKNDRSGKGKEKAVESEEPEEEPQDNNADNPDFQYQFSDYGPGPSGGFRSPDRTMVVPTSNRLSGGHPSFQTQEFLTQETLVGTGPNPPTQFPGARKQASMRAHTNQPERRIQAHPAPSTSPLPSQTHPSTTASGPPHLLPPPPFPEKRRTLFKAARRRSNQSGSPERGPASQQTAQPSPSHKPEAQPATIQIVPRPGRKKRNPEAVPPRAVRASSRLRSVEPEIFPLPGRRNARKKQINPIPEEQEEHEGLIKETLAEEMDVANQLAADAPDISSVLPQSQNLGREPSMDSDDASIAANLRGQSSRFNVNGRFDILKGPQPKDMLRFAQSLRRNSMLPRVDTWERAQIPSQRKSAPSQLRNEAPRTPLIQRGSSTESFPVPGTRASALMQSLQKIESRSPFTPAPGTKAERLLHSQE